MTVMKRTLSFVFIFLLCVSCVFAFDSVQKRLQGLTEAQLTEYLNGRLEFYGPDEDITLPAANGSIGEKNASEALHDESGFALSLGKFVPYPENWKNLSDGDKMLKVMNVLGRISTMKGLTYISYSKGEKPALLFSDAYVIKDTKHKTHPKPDYVFNRVPERFDGMAYLHDAKFGGHAYGMTYTIGNDEIILDIENLDNLKYMGITALKKNNLNMFVDIVFAEEGMMLFSMAHCTNTKSEIKALVVTVDLPSAFMRRIRSLTNWFCEQVEL